MFKSRKYRQLEKNYERLIEQCEDLSFKLDNERSNSKELQASNTKRIQDLERQQSIVVDTNQKLIDWIFKMIEKVGVYEVNSSQRITIPMYKPDGIKAAYNDNIRPINPGYLRQEEIIIPEIRFVKMS